MKLIIYFLLLSVITFDNCYSQYECNTGITTELRSSSNGRPGAYNWKGWACGVNGMVIRCDNPPYAVWVNVSGNGIPSNVTLDNICGMDGSNALVCGHFNSNTWVWKTTNGGANWMQVFNQPNGMMNAVYMENNFKGFMVGNPVNGRWSLWKTNNGGVNWDSSGLYLVQSGNESGWPNSLCVGEYQNDTNKIWFGTNNSKVYYSSNYGQSWNIQSTLPEQNSLIIAYVYNYTQTCVFLGGSNYLLKSTNYGTNWIQDTVGGTGGITGIAALAWSIELTRGDKIYSKFLWNGGWSPRWTAPAGIYTYIDNRYGGGNWADHYAVRTNGGITFNTEGEGIKKISDNIPSNYLLSQNYPNPFNPTTKIKFDIPASLSFGEGQRVRLSIYDALGKEIAVLVNENLKPGTYEVNWNASSYPSGVYFYQLQSGDFIQTKKMILIK